MSDAKLIEKLRLIERELDNYLWYQEAGLGDAIREAIERLTPGKMTLEEIAKILNEKEHRGFKKWEPFRHGVDNNGVHNEEQYEWLIEMEARLVAGEYMRIDAEKEEADA